MNGSLLSTKGVLIPAIAVVAKILSSSGYRMYLSQTDGLHLESWKATVTVGFYSEVAEVVRTHYDHDIPDRQQIAILYVPRT